VRRAVWAGIVAAGVVAAAGGAVAVRGLSRSHAVSQPAPTQRPPSSATRAFLGPLAVGAHVERWVVQELFESPTGAVAFVLGPEGESGFRIDVFRRDDGGARPVATTRSLALYVDNMPLRDGQSIIAPDQLEAAQALARTLQAREDAGAPVPMLPTLRATATPRPH